MPDRRFFISLDPASLGELARLTGAEPAEGSAAECLVHSVAALERAGPGELAFCADVRHAEVLARTRAQAVFVSGGLSAHPPEGCAVLLTPRPQAAFALAASRLHQPRVHDGSIHIHPEAQIEENVVLGPGVVVGQGARVGRGAVLSAGAAIGPEVAIGRDGYVGPNAVIGFALIGDRVRIHGGAVVGEPGFGATAGEHGIIDVPQLGRVIIQDAVTVGAGACIDRGALGDTVVGENTKIDNLVQIGHNVLIGRNCVLAAHTGISGSVVIGDGCMFGGRAGAVDHIRIGAGARIAAGAGVSKDVPPGETWAGYPARPLRRWRREAAWVSLRSARKTATGGEHDVRD